VRLPLEVFVFVRRGEEYLVLHRSRRQGAYWHCVAGGVEEGESYPAAAARELYEETGLDAVLLDLRRPYDSVLEDGELRRLRGADQIHVECFLAEAPEGWEPSLDWEHDEYRWCRADEAAALLHWPEPRQVLQELLAR
jgi:8-oxo-dGTP pyrophosphatase MutT (NUDIX family)